MGPGGTITNPQQGPDTPYWTQPSQANLPAQVVGGGVEEPVFPPPAPGPPPPPDGE